LRLRAAFVAMHERWCLRAPPVDRAEGATELGLRQQVATGVGGERVDDGHAPGQQLRLPALQHVDA